MLDIKNIAEQSGVLVIDRSGYTEYGCMDIDLEKFATLIEKQTVKNCRDMFINDSVSWNLMNSKYEACDDND